MDVKPELSRELELLRTLVEAHQRPDESGQREPIYFYETAGGRSFLQHPGFGTQAPTVDRTDIDDLSAKGLLDIGYTPGRALTLTPSLRGREVVAEIEMAFDDQPTADVAPIVAALERQLASPNKLAWPAVRLVLDALRRYWEESGFPVKGVALLPIYVASPEAAEDLFAETVRSLIRDDYLESAMSLSSFGSDLPGAVRLTPRTFSVLDGWPGASEHDLAENLLAVLAERAATATDPEQKRRLERVAETVRELGIATVGEVMSRVILGLSGASP